MTDVDPASHHRRRAVFRHAAGCLVADRGGDAASAYFDFVNWIFGSWIGRLVLFGYTWALHAPHAGRHPPPHLGHRHRPREATSTKLAWANLAGSVVLTILIWIAGYTALRRPDHDDMRTPLGKVRGLGSAKRRHRAFLAPAADRGRQHSADPVLRRLPDRLLPAPPMPTSCARSRTRSSPSS